MPLTASMASTIMGNIGLIIAFDPEATLWRLQ